MVEVELCEAKKQWWFVWRPSSHQEGGRWRLRLLENNGQIAFLDTLVSRRNGVAVIDVYRKQTHTDRYLDFSSHHDIKHKISTASTLLFRASSIPSSHEGKTRETNHVRAALEVNGYPSSVISTILNKKPPSPTVPPPEELVSMFFKWADPSDTHKGFACLLLHAT